MHRQSFPTQRSHHSGHKKRIRKVNDSLSHGQSFVKTARVEANTLFDTWAVSSSVSVLSSPETGFGYRIVTGLVGRGCRGGWAVVGLRLWVQTAHEEAKMGVSFGIIWGVALVLIGGLALFLALSLRRKAGTEPERISDSKEIGSVHDTLLFDFGEKGVRSTTHGHVIIRIPGAAWKEDWRQDLIRVEVSQMPPDAVDLSDEWSGAKVLAAFGLCAYRVAEMGMDVEVERFEAPIDIIIAFGETDRGLSLLVQQGNEWVSAAPITVSPEEIGGVHLPADRVRIGVSVLEMGPVCLVQMSELAQPLT